MEIKAVLVKRCGLEIASFMRSYAKRKPTIRFNPERCTANADKGVKTGERGKERLYRERTRRRSIYLYSQCLGINFTIINCEDIINSSLDRLS